MAEHETHKIRLRTIIEVLGTPKEHVQKATGEYIEAMREDKDIIIIREQFSDIEEKDGHYLMFVELELLIKGLPKLINFCFEYMPSSLEIHKPDSFTMTQTEFSGFLNDLQARLHTVDMTVKQLKNENNFLKKNLATMLENSLGLILHNGPRSLEHLSKLTGVTAPELDKFLERLITENKIKKEGETYTLVT